MSDNQKLTANWLGNEFSVYKHPVKFNQVPGGTILTTLCCCLPFGIVSIIFASKVDGLYAAGDYEGASQAAASAKKWALFGVIGWVVLVVLYIVFFVFLGVAGAFGN